ncbi:MAG: hypothetical protein U1C50_01895 [Patescibacteria group bacterium]|nr:hypothetical protein [Patescibacteria group bacterium]MDP4031016.1 hypothetical protein [Candidatus Beckwithbacteria bacterium]MDZ4228987.1 hypothetical protein [Patescibacteria group bacterium]
MTILAVILFVAGVLIDVWFGRRLGQTSLILLLILGAFNLLKNFYPKPVNRQIKLK